MLPVAVLAAPSADVAIVEGAARARAGRAARFHVTLLHAGDGVPAPAIVHFGDGHVTRLRYARGASPHVFDADAVHAFARPGRYAIAVRAAGGRLLASETVTVVPAPAAPRQGRSGAAPGEAAGAPVIVAPGGASPAADPRHAGILVTPGLPGVPAAPAPILVQPVPAGVPAAAGPADLPAGGLAPHGSLAPLPTATPRLTTGDR